MKALVAVVAVFAVLVVLTEIAIRHDDALEEHNFRAFNTDCLAHGRAQYECTAMWRSTAKDEQPVIVPIPVVVPR